MTSGGLTSLNTLACGAILGSELGWALGSVLSKRLEQPSSQPINSGAQMMCGGAMLLVGSLLLGEMQPLPHFTWEATGALLYLIGAGSLLAYSAYVWLLGQMPATKVATYAYVNPVVALAVGYWFGGEKLDRQTLAGAALVLGSVLLLFRVKARSH